MGTSNQERKCFNVNEMLCTLKENVQFEEIPAVFTVQKCHKMKERVCDTVYETELSEKDDFKCITVVNPYCAKKDHTVYDKTLEQWLTLIVKLMVAILMEEVPVVVVILTMEEPAELMEIAVMSRNINARSRMKLNATQCHVLLQANTVRTEKRKFARSLLRRCLFQLKGKIVMMKTRKYVN